MITDINQLDLNKRYTYADYLTWQLKERVELIKGKIFKMSPAPNVRHQRVSMNMIRELLKLPILENCQLFSAPFDVRLPVALEDGKTDTVVQPDLCIICDESKLDEQGCNGAPDLVIEILSKGNSQKEMKNKFELYESSLIPEYWMVDPEHESIVIYSLDEKNKYIGSKPFVGDEIASSSVYLDLKIAVKDIFV